MAMRIKSSARFRCAARPAAQVRGPMVVQANLFSFLTPTAPSKNAKAQNLVKDLLSLSSTTKAGTAASPATRQDVEKLAAELKAFSAKNPSTSKLLAGDYEVVYVSNPAAPGSPFEGPSGVIPFIGKLPSQTISPSGDVVNQVATKSFGFVEGFSKQFGQIQAVGPDTYKLVLTKAEIKSGLGPLEVINLEASLNVDILYLGDDLRVVQSSVESEEDSDILIVYKRVVEEEKEEREEAESSPVGTLFASPKKTEGFATMSERQVRRQMEAEQEQKQGGTSFLKRLSGTAVVSKPKAGGAQKLGGGTQKLDPKAAAEERKKAAEAAKAEQEAQAARMKAEREQEAAKKAAEAKAAKERAEGQRKAAAEKQAEIKALLADLAEQVKEAQAENKEAAAALRDVERSFAATLKEVDVQKRKVAAAEEETKQARTRLEEAQDVKIDAERMFSKAKSDLNQAQAGLKKAESAMLVSK